ncbi:hypothetical protein P0G10_11735 [Eubacteriales bacterium DFI.9.88]|nr:hypothetical protein [Eubacteriales bacterium DFI.9.88]
MKTCICVLSMVLIFAVSLIGCGRDPADVQLSDQQIKSVTEQLSAREPYDQDEAEYLDVQTFDSLKVYGAREKEGYTEIYVWDLSGDFVKYKDAAYELSGSSMPLTLVTEISGESVKLINVKFPEDGDRYGPSIEAMFPEKYAKEAIGEGNGLVGKLKKEQKEKIKALWNVEISEDLFDLNPDTGAFTITRVVNDGSSGAEDFKTKVIEKGRLTKKEL